MRRVRLSDERGSALVLALIFLSLFSLWIAAVLSFSETGVRVTRSVREQRSVVYAADGAVDAAINKIRQDATLGLEGPNCFGPGVTEYTPPAVNGNAVTVHCDPQPGSGQANNAGSSPSLGILTLAKKTPLEEGLVLTSNAILRVNGGVYSHSTIKTGGGSSLLNACPPSYPATQAECTATSTPGALGTVTTLGACSPNIIATTLRCNNPDLPPDNIVGVDPDYPPASVVGLADEVVPPCPPAPANGKGQVVRIPPGRYTSAAALNALTSSGCNGPKDNNLYWFLPKESAPGSGVYTGPGVYYFDFPVGDDVWSISGSNKSVVGGEPDWLPPSGPQRYSEITPGGIPPRKNCKTDPTGATHPHGVQFIFGGTSRLSVGQASKVEMCADQPAGVEQQIAIYGVNPANPRGLTPESGCIVTPSYVNPNSTNCPVLQTNDPSTQFAVHGTIYAPAAPVDIGFPGGQVNYTIIDRGILSRALTLKVTPAADLPGALISSPGLGWQPTYNDRDVVLTACINGSCSSGTSIKKLRARATFASAGAPSVKSWAVLR